MIPTLIRLTLKSATTFGRGDGLVGVVDREIEHDEHGFPFLRGKTLKGLLVESAANVTYALESLQKKNGWSAIQRRLFGEGGRGIQERGILHVGDATLPAALRADLLEVKWPPQEVLAGLTGIRRQTAINVDGGPDYATLRSMRVLLPGISLEAPISFDTEPTSDDLSLLAAAVLDLRRAGTGRNRGRGWLSAELEDDETTRAWYNRLVEALT